MKKVLLSLILAVASITHAAPYNQSTQEKIKSFYGQVNGTPISFLDLPLSYQASYVGWIAGGALITNVFRTKEGWRISPLGTLIGTIIVHKKNYYPKEFFKSIHKGLLITLFMTLEEQDIKSVLATLDALFSSNDTLGSRELTVTHLNKTRTQLAAMQRVFENSKKAPKANKQIDLLIDHIDTLLAFA